MPSRLSPVHHSSGRRNDDLKRHFDARRILRQSAPTRPDDLGESRIIGRRFKFERQRLSVVVLPQ